MSVAMAVGGWWQLKEIGTVSDVAQG